LKIGMTLEETTDTLIHEYAHLLSVDYYGRLKNVVWAIAYSECYDLIHDGH